MTRLQRLSAELGERRRRLLDLEGLDGTAPAERKGEAEALRSQITDLQGRWDSEHQAEAESERLALGMLGNGDGEPAEVRSLRGRVSLADYLTPASAGAAVAGAPAELNAALGVPIAGPGGGVAVPYAALLGPEHEPMARGVRTPMAAFTTTAVHDGPLQDRPILQRLFGPGLLNQLGVRLDAVEQGRSEWPIITSGTTVGAVAEGTAAGAAVAAVFTARHAHAEEVDRPLRVFVGNGRLSAGARGGFEARFDRRHHRADEYANHRRHRHLAAGYRV